METNQIDRPDYSAENLEEYSRPVKRVLALIALVLLIKIIAMFVAPQANASTIETLPNNGPVRVLICDNNPTNYLLYQDAIRANGQPKLYYGESMTGETIPAQDLFLSPQVVNGKLCKMLSTKKGDTLLPNVKFNPATVRGPERIEIAGMCGPTFNLGKIAIVDKNGFQYTANKTDQKTKNCVSISTYAPRAS